MLLQILHGVFRRARHGDGPHIFGVRVVIQAARVDTVGEVTVNVPVSRAGHRRKWIARQELPRRRVVVAGPQILEPGLGVDSPRRSLHAPENILGDRVGTVAELTDDELGVLRSVIDGLVAKSRLRALAGGVS